jgi:hypothetical protein
MSGPPTDEKNEDPHPPVVKGAPVVTALAPHPELAVLLQELLPVAALLE